MTHDASKGSQSIVEEDGKEIVVQHRRQPVTITAVE
jgi:hypothetical protein